MRPTPATNGSNCPIKLNAVLRASSDLRTLNGIEVAPTRWGPDAVPILESVSSISVFKNDLLAAYSEALIFPPSRMFLSNNDHCSYRARIPEFSVAKNWRSNHGL